MSTARPFGDPTNIRRENVSAVGKGVAFGCGGCLGLAGIMVIIILVIGGIGLKMFRSSGPCQAALRAAQASPEMREKLGEPMELGWLMTGNISTIHGSGSANLNVLIHGPKGKAGIRVVGKSSAGVWRYEEMTASVASTGEKLSLLSYLESPPPALSSADESPP
jgi:hypothetical protein